MQPELFETPWEWTHKDEQMNTLDWAFECRLGSSMHGMRHCVACRAHRFDYLHRFMKR